MRAVVALSILALVACGSSLPRPPKGEPPGHAYAEVPYPPPPAQVERLPERPEGAVWVDGSWTWTGTRWRWRDGGWFERPAKGVVYADWEIRRPSGTSLRFAAAAWRDAKGAEVPAPRLLASASMAPGLDAGGDAATEAGAVDAGAADVGAADAELPDPRITDDGGAEVSLPSTLH